MIGSDIKGEGEDRVGKGTQNALQNLTLLTIFAQMFVSRIVSGKGMHLRSKLLKSYSGAQPYSGCWLSQE